MEWCSFLTCSTWSVQPALLKNPKPPTHLGIASLNNGLGPPYQWLVKKMSYSWILPLSQVQSSPFG